MINKIKFSLLRVSRAQNYSEETAQKIDLAIKEVIDEQYCRAKQILTDNLDALHASAEALLEHETIEGKHIHEILEHGKIISEIIKVTKQEEAVEENEEDVKEKVPKKR